MTGVFLARFDSGCLACTERIREGDEVKWADGSVIHADCMILDGLTEVPRTCPTCNLVPAASGECGCDW